jgi:hypothetical protein
VIPNPLFNAEELPMKNKRYKENKTNILQYLLNVKRK